MSVSVSVSASASVSVSVSVSVSGCHLRRVAGQFVHPLLVMPVSYDHND